MGNVHLLVQVEPLDEALLGQIALGSELANREVVELDDAAMLRSDYLSWDEYNRALLDSAFEVKGFLTQSPGSDYGAVGVQLLDLTLTSTVLPLGRVDEVRAVILEKCRVLNSIRERLQTIYAAAAKTAPASQPKGEAIFLIHGHNTSVREEVRRYVERITGRTVIVLAEQPGGGQDLLGKLLNHAEEAAFAVALLTGDDEARPAGSSTAWLPRARQNVVLELGLFLGLLGRSGVVALYEEGVEIPSDYAGVEYISLSHDWKLKLASELRSANIEVDVNRAL